MGLCAIIDVETTGLNPTTDKIIEAAVILMQYNDSFDFTNLVSLYSSFNDPLSHIPEKITKITNITDDMVKSHKINWKKFHGILNKADIIIAHNVKFDKSFIRQQGKFKEDKKYACSLEMIDWRTKHGQSCRKLQHLGFEHSIIMENAHRAIDDVKLLIKLLKCKSKGDESKTYFQELMSKVGEKQYKVTAEFKYNYDKKELVKKNGFRWINMHKYWHKTVVESELETTTKFLKDNGMGCEWREEK